jgi:hypothetical protein
MHGRTDRRLPRTGHLGIAENDGLPERVVVGGLEEVQLTGGCASVCRRGMKIRLDKTGDDGTIKTALMR